MKNRQITNQVVVGRQKTREGGFFGIIKNRMQINRTKLISNLVKIATYLIIFYILFLLSRSLWTNYTLRRTIDQLNGQIVTLSEEKKTLENLNLYYRSDSFKELEARKKLGLKAIGEKVMILPASPSGGATTATPQNFSEELEKEKEGTANQTPESPIPNWFLWWEFFTK